MAVIRALVEVTGAGLIVLDSLRRLAPGAREDKSDDVARLFSGLAQITRDLHVAIVVIHHRSTKLGAADTRGSSAIEDQADLVFVLEHVARDPDRNRRRLRCVKFRIDEEPPPIWLRRGHVGEHVTLDAAEPFVADDDDDAPDDSAEARMVARIRSLAPNVNADLAAGGWPPWPPGRRRRFRTQRRDLQPRHGGPDRVG